MKRPAIHLLLALVAASCLAQDSATNAPVVVASANVARQSDHPPVVSGLSFHLVAEDSDARARALVSAVDEAAPDGFLATADDYGFVRDSSRAIDSSKLRAFGNPPAGQICLMERISETLYAPVFVEDPPVWRQFAPLRSCKADIDLLSQSIITGKFGKRDARAFADVTAANARNPGTPGRRLAIVLGDAVICSPYIREPIREGVFNLSGAFTPDEAAFLAEIIGSADPVAATGPTPFIWDLIRPSDSATNASPEP